MIRCNSHPMKNYKITRGEPFAFDMGIFGFIVDKQGTITYYFVIFYKYIAITFGNIIRYYLFIRVTVLPLIATFGFATLDSSG